MNTTYPASSLANEMNSHFWLMTSMLLLVFALQLTGVIDVKKSTSSAPVVAAAAQTPLPPHHTP
ncbi:hypothetical protein [Hymenobacter sp. YC55]|uniref:hypothetical protein n=1 Tax=Hymenobacter sp. YC55 TaxID=3034019 RepID=UPI0023F6DC73|nr:hypothetical protein [Hymenobacter sp. YC55]MDF7815087.1 hypothetical protein [Hymenobacter sp. YC55]